MDATLWVVTPPPAYSMELTRLLIRRTKAGNPIVLQARKETAEFYGWTKHFERHIEGFRYDEASGVAYCNQPRLKRTRQRMGIGLTISRGSSKHSHNATYSNQFRISSEATIADIAKVAKFTDVDWHWMETPSGERRSREEWLSLHEAWTQ